MGLIVRPSSAGLSPGQLVALAAAVGFAVSVTMVKSLTRTDSALAIIFWMLVVQSLLGLLPALWVWRWPSADCLGLGHAWWPSAAPSRTTAWRAPCAMPKPPW